MSRSMSATGETFGIVGESGSGKSTVLRAIAGLDAAHREASDRRHGRCRGRSERALSGGSCSIVFQDPYGSLHPRQTVDEILREPLIIQGIGEHRREGDRAIAEVGLCRAIRFRYPHQLSGGQRQRVAIARAHDPQAADPAPRRADLGARRFDPGGNPQPPCAASSGSYRLTSILVSHDLAVVGAPLQTASPSCARAGWSSCSMSRGCAGGRPMRPMALELLAASRGYVRHAGQEPAVLPEA